MLFRIIANRAPPEAHAYVALDVERRRPREAEGLHVGVDHGLVHGSVHAPRALEARDELVVHWAPVVVDQLDAAIGAVVGVAVVDHDVEAVKLRPHVDQEGERVAHVHGAGDASARGAVAGADLHVALGRGQRKVHRVSCVHPGENNVRIRVLRLALGLQRACSYIYTIILVGMYSK